MSEPSTTGAISRSARMRVLVGIAVALAAVALSLYAAGAATDSPLLRFAGLMVGATTWVPLPADTFVLSASADIDAVTIGVVGGLINATVVMFERRWLLALIDHPSFGRLQRFFDTNRFVSWTERNMFLALIVGGTSFIPFEPFRLIAVMRGYPPQRYFVATFLARGGRYFVLASVGAALLEVGVLREAIWVTLGLFILGLWRSLVNVLRGVEDTDADADADDG